MALTPPFEVVNNWVSTSPCYDPDDVFVAVIDLLVLCIGRDKREVARNKFLFLFTIGPADDSAMALGCVYKRIWKPHQRKLVGMYDIGKQV